MFIQCTNKEKAGEGELGESGKGERGREGEIRRKEGKKWHRGDDEGRRGCVEGGGNLVKTRVTALNNNGSFIQYMYVFLEYQSVSSLYPHTRI